MGIDNLIEPIGEDVLDTSDDIHQQIVQDWSPAQEEEASEEANDEALPRVTPFQALLLLQDLRLHEEQSTDCNNDWITALERQEKVVRARYSVGQQQSYINNYFHSL